MEDFAMDSVKLDIVGLLPSEVGFMILRNLHDYSLLHAAAVSKRWNSLCSGDRTLRANGRWLRSKMLSKRKKCLVCGTVRRVISWTDPTDADAIIPYTGLSDKEDRNILLKMSMIWRRSKRIPRAPGPLKGRPSVDFMTGEDYYYF